MARHRPDLEPLRRRAREVWALRLWRELAPRATGLRTEDGLTVRVLYPGRPSPGAGPDFRDAVLVVGPGRVVRGDVEVHLEARGWEAHGHDQSPRYNRVVLHAVVWPQGRRCAPLAVGASAPVLSLLRLKHARPPVHRAPVPLGELGRAGDLRFWSKARALGRLASGAGAEEALYRGLMEALGYQANRRPFLHLAEGLPLSRLRRLLTGVKPPERGNALLAVLAGSAGFLASLPGPVRAWAEALGVAPLLPAGAWEVAGTRPANHPLRRLEGMALLLERHWEGGLVEPLAAPVARGDRRGLLNALMVGAGPALIGQGRAGDMAVNVVLPFLWWWGHRGGRPELARGALALFRAWPPLQGNHLLEEALRFLGMEGARPPGARHQQGALHLYLRGLEGLQRVGRAL